MTTEKTTVEMVKSLKRKSHRMVSAMAKLDPSKTSEDMLLMLSSLMDLVTRTAKGMAVDEVATTDESTSESTEDGGLLPSVPPDLG